MVISYTTSEAGLLEKMDAVDVGRLTIECSDTDMIIRVDQFRLMARINDDNEMEVSVDMPGRSSVVAVTSEQVADQAEGQQPLPG